MESAAHWAELLNERGKISEEQLVDFKEVAAKVHLKLNNLIKATYQAKQKK